MNQRVQYAIDNFFEENFFDRENNSYHLKELDTQGRSDLYVTGLRENLCVSGFDRKHACNFLRQEKKYGMKMRSDHLIFEHNSGKWRMIIVEMKTTVGNKTWAEIKLKTRATYLNAMAIAAVLGIRIDSVMVCTTYEKEKFEDLVDQTNPYASLPALGRRMPDYKKDEWDKGCIHINLGELNLEEFPHKKIQMQKDNDGQMLAGTWDATCHQ